MNRNKTIFQVDAFTDEPFKGNPAGVMILDEPVTSEWMQNIAMEMNLSETAFIAPNGNIFSIRYFTPTQEVDLCGHATLASAHIIYELGIKGQNDQINFKAKGGELIITKDKYFIIMNFPAYSIKKAIIPKDFKRIAGFDPVEYYTCDYGWAIAVAKNEIDILESSPDFEAMKRTDYSDLMITAKSTSYEADFIVRCFAPAAGINEDPVTGSAHCALTPLWSEKLGKLEMDSYQVSKRTGKLKVKLLNNRVEIKGKAVTVFEGILKI